ncbi:MAG TPA: PAS domain S-box protein [Abditibacteriaceae bacterium]
MLSCVLTVALVSCFGFLQWYLIQAFGLQMIFLMFFPPIMISAWFGGWRLGLTATLFSALFADYFFLEPLYQLWPISGSETWTQLIFVLEGLFISVLGEIRRQSRQALLDERNLLEQRVAERTQEISLANEQLAQQIIEREKAQAALSESELRFRSVVETADDAIVMSDQGGNIIAWNRGAQKMFGYSTEEALNQPVGLIIPSDLKQSHDFAMARLRNGAPPHLMGQPLELRGLRRDGSEFPLELSLATWEVGEQKFYSGIMRDLSLRKQAEADRLRLSEEMAAHAQSQAAEQRYRLLAEAIPQIVWTATPDGATDYFNQHWFDYTGVTLEQSVGWNWQAVVHPDDQQRSFETWKQALQSGDDFEVEYRFRKQDGTYRWHLGRAVPLRAAVNEKTQIIKWFGTCTDIEVQKSTEATSRFLAEAMSQLTASINEKAIVETLANLCAPALATWCVVDLIEMVDTTEIAPSAVAGTTSTYLSTYLSTLHSPPTLRRAVIAPKDLQEPIENQDKTNSEMLYVAPQGDVVSGPWRALEKQRTETIVGADLAMLVAKGAVWEAWHDTLVNGTLQSVLCVPLTARGRALGVLTLFCTDAVQCDETNIGVAQDLARNAALMIDNARLLHQTQEANRAKDEFLAILSHELRTPLTAILGWVQLLQSPSLDEETRHRAFETIERNTHAQAQLIEGLLDLSRVVTGKLHLDIQPVEIKPLVEAALDAVRPAAQAKEITLLFSPVQAPFSSSVVLGDGHHLQQVFWNLLSNSIKFTPKGGRIEVSLRHSDSHLEISVRDNGQGISAELLPYVFERFRQGDSSSTRQHGGLGLGLSIVRHVTELHGGSVQVESKGKNQGTDFKVLLPLAPLREPAANDLKDTMQRTTPEDNTAPAATDASAQMLQGVRVLLVDDERDTRDMLSAILRRYGADVQTCASAQEAIDALPQWQPRVLVSDIGMPLRDGYDLIRYVRALPQEQGGEVPAMALTAYARASDRELALEAGFNRHVVKPVDPVTLATQVAELAGLN